MKEYPSTAYVIPVCLPGLRSHCRSCMAWKEIRGTLYTLNSKDREENGRNLLQYMGNIQIRSDQARNTYSKQPTPRRIRAHSQTNCESIVLHTQDLSSYFSSIYHFHTSNVVRTLASLISLSLPIILSPRTLSAYVLAQNCPQSQVFSSKL